MEHEKHVYMRIHVGVYVYNTCIQSRSGEMAREPKIGLYPATLSSAVYVYARTYTHAHMHDTRIHSLYTYVIRVELSVPTQHPRVYRFSLRLRG